MVYPAAAQAWNAGTLLYYGHTAFNAIKNFLAAPTAWGFATAAAALVYLIDAYQNPVTAQALANGFGATFQALGAAIAGLRAYFGI